MNAKWTCIVLLLAAPACAADWPQFRGPDRSGISKETGLPLEWSATKNVVWKTELPGPGSSSPIVINGRVYVTCYSGYGLDIRTPGNLADLKRHLVCADAKSGKVLWTRTETDPDATDALYKDGNIALHGYASHTPTADADGVYAYFGAAGAVCYNHDGERKWGVRLGDKAKVHTYGSGASPLLHGNLFIVNAVIETTELYQQGETVAIDKKTGKVVWREKAGGQWSSPQLVTVGGKAELVVATHHPGPWLGLDPLTGKRLWECKAKDGCGMPVVHDGVVYTFHGDGKAAIKAGGRGEVTDTHKLWETTSGARISSPVYYDGHLYWTSDGHIAHCADVRTGKSVYRERLGKGGNCYASPVLAEGRIYYVSRDMGAYVVAAKPEYELLAPQQDRRRQDRLQRLARSQWRSVVSAKRQIPVQHRQGVIFVPGDIRHFSSSSRTGFGQAAACVVPNKPRETTQNAGSLRVNRVRLNTIALRAARVRRFEVHGTRNDNAR